MYGFSNIIVMYQIVLCVEYSCMVFMNIIVCRTLLCIQHDFRVEHHFCILKIMEGRTPLPHIKHDYVSIRHRHRVTDVIVCRMLSCVQQSLNVEHNFCVLKTAEGRTPLPHIEHDRHHVMNVVACSTLSCIQYGVSVEQNLFHIEYCGV